MSRAARIAISVVLVVQLAATFGSSLGRWPVGEAVREWTKPWEKVLGVHQTWPRPNQPCAIDGNLPPQISWRLPPDRTSNWSFERNPPRATGHIARPLNP